MRIRCVGVVMMVLALGAVADAHVGVSPKQAVLNAVQTYTIRVPAEGNVATTLLELEMAPGLELVSVAAPDGVTHQLKNDGDRVVAVLWTMHLQPGSVVELSLVVKNPASGQILWKAHQHFADGTVNHYDGPPGSRRPALATTLSR